MPRLMLTDEHWSKLRAILLEGRVYDKPEHRNTMEGILYRMRVGCPWRDLPESFGLWNTIFRRFLLWSRKGILQRLFKKLITEPDFEWIFIDGSIVKAHQHSAGANSKEDEAIGKSKGGNTSKIHLAVDSYGLPIEFTITGGQLHDSKAAKPLIEMLPYANHIIADKGYDSEGIREQVRERNSIPNIPRKSNSKVGNDDIDWCLYKYRHLVENAFEKLKKYRAIATRYDKLKVNYESMVALALNNLRLCSRK